VLPSYPGNNIKIKDNKNICQFNDNKSPKLMSTVISRYTVFAIYKYASDNGHSCYIIALNFTSVSTVVSDNSQRVADMRYAFVFPIRRCHVAAITEGPLALQKTEVRFEERLEL
jgi:hypothetical protein